LKIKTVNIWFLHHYAEPPDGQWTATYELAKQLVNRGHDVTVYASSFNHYTREDSRMPPGESSVIEQFDGVNFVFIKTRPYWRNDWRRAINMLSYSLRVTWFGLRTDESPDFVVGSTPHPFAPIAAFILARVKRAKFVFEVRDLWPLFPIEMGQLSKNSPTAIALRWIEKFCFKRAEKIVTIWPGMDRYVEERGVSPQKTIWLPVGIDMANYESFDVRDPHDKDRETFDCMYRGGFGESNDIITILRAAQILNSRGERHIRIMLVGEGPAKQELIEYSEQLGLTNVEFQDFVPKDQLGKALASADGFICSLPDVPHFQKYGQIPTKLLDYLAAGRPIVLTTNAKSNMVDAAQAGLVVPPENPEKLAQAISELATRSLKDQAQMGANGVNYVRQHHDIGMLADRMEKALTGLLN
jgi:glycosyltransferase involved in cell wall biosynthesis